MLGFILSLVTAVSEATKDVVSKYNLHHIDEYTAAFMMHLVQSLLLFPIVSYLGFESMSSRFLWALFVSTLLQLWVILLYFKAIKRSRISVAVPLITLTPIFMLVTSPIMVGQFPNTVGIGGIVLIVAGTYISNLSSGPDKLLAPFMALVKNQGSRYMLLVAFIWSITSNLDKIGVDESSPLFWVFVKDFVILLYLTPILLVKSKEPMQQINQRLWPLFAVGFFRFISVASHMYAIELILVPYVIAVKRVSTAFVILFGFFFMNEKVNIKNRMIGITVTLIGLFVIAISST